MTPPEVWAAVLAAVREHSCDSRVELWLDRPIRVEGISANRLALRVDPKKIEWVRRRYGRLLGELVREVSDLDGVVVRREELHRPDFAKALELGE